MSRSCAIVLALCGLVAVTTVPGSVAQAYDGSAVASSGGWDALGGLYALLAQHDALGGHALARKSVRSPSRRLRFGRRSDPDMPPQAPLDEVLAIRDERSPARLRFGRRSDESAAPHDLSQQLDEILREERSPARLRFGRRSEENAVAHQLPQELEDMLTVRDERSPARLRFGRRSDELTFPHVFPQELHEASEDMSRDVRAPARLRFGRRSDEHAVPHIIPQEEQDRAVRAPSMRLRFGRRSDNNMFVMPFESTVPKEVKASGSVEDDRQD